MNSIPDSQYDQYGQWKTFGWIALVVSSLLAGLGLVEAGGSFVELFQQFGGANSADPAVVAAQQAAIGSFVESLLLSPYSILSLLIFLLSGVFFSKAIVPGTPIKDHGNDKGTIGYALSFAHYATRKGYYVWITTMILLSLIIGLNYYAAIALVDQPGLYLIQQIVSVVVNILIGLSVLGLTIKTVYNNEVPELNDLLRYVTGGKFWKMITSTLYYVLLLLGTIVIAGVLVGILAPNVLNTASGGLQGGTVLGNVLIVAMVVSSIIGILLFFIVAVRGQFYNIAVAKDDLGWYRAVNRSLTVTKGHFWTIIGFSLVAGLINVLGMIPLGLGLLYTLPLTQIAKVKLYEIMERRNMSSSQHTNRVHDTLGEERGEDEELLILS